MQIEEITKFRSSDNLIFGSHCDSNTKEDKYKHVYKGKQKVKRNSKLILSWKTDGWQNKVMNTFSIKFKHSSLSSNSTLVQSTPSNSYSWNRNIFLRNVSLFVYFFLMISTQIYFFSITMETNCKSSATMQKWLNFGYIGYEDMSFDFFCTIKPKKIAQSSFVLEYRYLPPARV